MCVCVCVCVCECVWMRADVGVLGPQSLTATHPVPLAWVQKGSHTDGESTPRRSSSKRSAVVSPGETDVAVHVDGKAGPVSPGSGAAAGAGLGSAAASPPSGGGTSGGKAEPRARLRRPKDKASFA
jgi:hypothetical protein